MFHVDDTIAAIASAPGGSLRGIIRVSGPDVVACISQCFTAGNGCDLAGVLRSAVLPGTLRTPPPIGDLECDLYLWPTERSYTKQPAAELHTIGSQPLLDAVLRTVCAAGARIAEPGEFTMRAFLAGRLDLTQAEAVLGVIDAQDRAELHVALSQLAGGLATHLNDLRHHLLNLLAHLEAGLDFAEEDIEFISPHDLEARLAAASARIEQIESKLTARAERDGDPRVVLVGWPNVGKSSLFNTLTGDSAAIVSQLPGTTRDYVSKTVEFDGLELLLIDTAGVDTADVHNEEAVAAAQKMMAEQNARADLQLFCIDASRPLNTWEEAELASQETTSRLYVLTKADVSAGITLPVRVVQTSSRTGEGLHELRRAVGEQIESLPDHEYLAVATTATRCGESLRMATQCLDRACQLAGDQLGEELIASEVRLALEELGRVVGAVYTEDILDRIFSHFCIGK